MAVGEGWHGAFEWLSLWPHMGIILGRVSTLGVGRPAFSIFLAYWLYEPKLTSLPGPQFPRFSDLGILQSHWGCQ